jgi:SAM-dependent methyltransferase
VVYNAAIFVFPDVQCAIQEAVACLEPGGQIAFSFYPEIIGPNDEDLIEEGFRRAGAILPRFRVVTDYDTACRALETRCGPVTHYRWARPLDLGFLKDFFSIPAQSASLFPGISYPQRRNLVHAVLDSLSEPPEAVGTVVWRMARAECAPGGD